LIIGSTKYFDGDMMLVVVFIADTVTVLWERGMLRGGDGMIGGS
jgi:hypothetical protein